jgi:hypothetical protein
MAQTGGARLREAVRAVAQGARASARPRAEIPDHLGRQRPKRGAVVRCGGVCIHQINSYDLERKFYQCTAWE